MFLPNVDREKLPTRVLAAGRARLKEAGIEDATTCARLFLECATGQELSRLVLDTGPLDEADTARFMTMVQRRLSGEAPQYITQKAYFCGRPYYVDRRVLIPRPETECVIESAMELIKPGDRVLDLCTGSGCMAITLHHYEPRAHVTASDISEDALAVCRKNAAELGAPIRVVQGDLFEAVKGDKFNLIVSNPPYVETGAGDKLVTDNEPHLALFAGEDGLDVIRRMTMEAKEYLISGGWLIFEHGDGQSDAISDLLKNSGYGFVFHVRDVAHKHRAIGGLWEG